MTTWRILKNARLRGEEKNIQRSDPSRAKGPKGEFIVRYRDRLYDIGEFLRHHPGGRSSLEYLRNRRIDAAFDENPHSKGARNLLEDFTVGNELRKGGEGGEGGLDDPIDWDSPILCQVGSLADRYWDWVNLPVNRRIRLFASDLLESLTFTPWYLIPIVWIPLCVYFLHAGLSCRDNSLALVVPSVYIVNPLFEAFTSYLSGVLLWTIIEYGLHRKLFHFRPPKNSKILITFHFLLHGIHHKSPFDDRRLLFPPVAGLAVARLLWIIYELVFPSRILNFVAAGTTTGYVLYDLMHYYLHYGSPRSGTYLYDMKRTHNYHHFLHHDRGFGISSGLWDRAFGTDVYPRLLRKPIIW